MTRARTSLAYACLLRHIIGIVATSFLSVIIPVAVTANRMDEHQSSTNWRFNLFVGYQLALWQKVNFRPCTEKKNLNQISGKFITWIFHTHLLSVVFHEDAATVALVHHTWAFVPFLASSLCLCKCSYHTLHFSFHTQSHSQKHFWPYTAECQRTMRAAENKIPHSRSAVDCHPILISSINRRLLTFRLILPDCLQSLAFLKKHNATGSLR